MSVTILFLSGIGCAVLLGWPLAWLAWSFVPQRRTK